MEIVVEMSFPIILRLKQIEEDVGVKPDKAK